MIENINIGKDIVIQIDIEEYLKRFEWDQARWREDRLIARSPFRDDNSPSFFVNFNNDWSGTWGDSGSGDTGNLVSLTAELYGITYEEAWEQLREEFFVKPYEVPDISIQLKSPEVPTSFELPKWCPSPYLEGRGIGEAAQLDYMVNEAEGQVNLPYIDGSGVVRAIKHRKVSEKDFWYQAGTHSINELLFGYHLVYEKKPTTMFICEAEIDAMSAYEMGYIGVSTGSAHLSDKQVELIVKTGVTNIVIAMDNDKAGNKASESILRKLGEKDMFNIYRAILPEGGDLNDFLQKTKGTPNRIKMKELSKVGHLGKKIWFRGI